MENKRIVVTGGNGFVGKKLVSYLIKQGYQVKSLNRVNGFDLTETVDPNSVEDFDCLVHLAALSFVPDSYKDPSNFYRTNFLTTLNALDLCRKKNAKIIYFSSYVYGIPQYLPLNEAHPLSAYNPYAQTKILCETLCEGYNRDFNLPVIILRPFNIFGNGQNDKFLISSILSQLKDGKSQIELKDPSPMRDYIHITDVIRAIDHAIASSIQYGTFNVCSNTSFSVEEITQIINRNLTHSVKFHFDLTGVRPSEVSNTLGSYDKIKEELGWEPKLSFEEGIKMDIEELNL